MPRTFDSGATRNSDADKYDYEGFLSPNVLIRFGEYMHKHRHLEDGTLRDSDNWQMGIPRDQLLKSLLRHVIEVWRQHRGGFPKEPLEDALCGIIFNAQGYLYEVLRAKGLDAEHAKISEYLT